MVGPPTGGRVFTSVARPGLADCAPSGRIRLDAIARWLQDVAYADVEDAGVAQAAVWVVRRARIRVERFPRFGERFELRTFCSGVGRMWAERRTSIASVGGSRGDAEAVSLGESGADVEAVAVWVHLDPISQRPTPLTEEEFALYGDAAAGRRVSARLRHPPPHEGKRRFGWRFRATECDLADHINNAAYWQPLEEELLAGVEPEPMEVEIEHRAPAQPGDVEVFCDGSRRWIVAPDGEMHASIVVRGLGDNST